MKSTNPSAFSFLSVVALIVDNESASGSLEPLNERKISLDIEPLLRQRFLPARLRSDA